MRTRLLRTAPIRRIRRASDDESGAVMVLFALVLIVLVAFVAFAIDLSRLYRERQMLQNSVDFGALAGAQTLPVDNASDAATAEALARGVATDNAPQLASGGLTITFRCIAGDRNNDGVPDAQDVPSVCGPASGVPWASGWTERRDKVFHDCNPYVGDRCNGMVLRATKTIPFLFAPVINIHSGSTGVLNAVACAGGCGSASTPVDVVMVLDRTRSMSEADLANAKNAALSVLDFYDDELQWVGLVALPYGRSSNKCLVSDPQNYPDPRASTWEAFTGLSRDYKNADGTLNTSSTIVSRINCLQRAPQGLIVRVLGNRSNAGHTNLGDPMDAAAEILSRHGRPDVPDAIIFLTDGEANQPDGLNPCNYLNQRANLGKAQGVSIYTIAYGVANARCNRDSGFFAGRFASTNLAMAASQPTNDNAPGGCASDENTDGDYYFCESGSADLEETFRAIATAIVKGSRLIE